VELGFQIPIVRGIPDSLSCIPESKNPEFRIPGTAFRILCQWNLKGLCHGSPVHFVFFSNYSPSIAMKLKVDKENTCK